MRWCSFFALSEEQPLVHRNTGKRKKREAQPDPLARADRARRTAPVGAYSKATTGLCLEDLTWAKELLPTSTLEGQAHNDLALEPPPPPPGEEWDRPFAGLHYTALTAPGHTDTRADTSRTCSACLGHANKLHALSALFCQISAGTLPLAARWLTRTRLCWQRKKNGKPRPIKMGELLRSAYAKRLVNQQQVILRSKVLRMHQWGISLPGACEGLCRWRGTIEPLAANGTLEPLVAVDLDLVNMFGNAEWPRIRQALRTHFLEASA